MAVSLSSGIFDPGRRTVFIWARTCATSFKSWRDALAQLSRTSKSAKYSRSDSHCADLDESGEDFSSSRRDYAMANQVPGFGSRSSNYRQALYHEPGTPLFPAESCFTRYRIRRTSYRMRVDGGGIPAPWLYPNRCLSIARYPAQFCNCGSGGSVSV